MKYLLMIAMAATVAPVGAAPLQPKEVVLAFMSEVRSGKAPERASAYMHEKVVAHQMNAEGETTVERTPQQYAEHVREFLAAYGAFDFKVTEQVAEGDRVYVRWQQDGKHLKSLGGETPSGRPLREIASAVYRVENHKIAEYWIQIDRYGFNRQLEAINTSAVAAGAKQ